MKSIKELEAELKEGYRAIAYVNDPRGGPDGRAIVRPIEASIDALKDVLKLIDEIDRGNKWRQLEKLKLKIEGT